MKNHLRLPLWSLLRRRGGNFEAQTGGVFDSIQRAAQALTTQYSALRVQSKVGRCLRSNCLAAHIGM